MGKAQSVAGAGERAAWYYVAGDQQCGPVTDTEFVQLCASGRILPDTMVWQQGFPNWIPFSQVQARIPVGTASVTATESVVLAYAREEKDPSNIFGWWWQVISRDYASFRGRARRKEFWSFLLVHLLILLGIVMIAVVVGPGRGGRSLVRIVLGLAIVGVCICLAIPHLAVLVRRLHDTGRSGFWFLITFLPYVGGLILLVLLAQDSESGTNAYGPNPKSAVRERL